MNNDSKIKLTGLWKKDIQGGDFMLSGSMSKSCKVVVFKNKYKNSADDPDYILYLEPAFRPTEPVKSTATVAQDDCPQEFDAIEPEMEAPVLEEWEYEEIPF